MKLTKIDMRKVRRSGEKLTHPDINTRASYLVRRGRNYYAGKFTMQWYGLNFGGIYDCGAQFDLMLDDAAEIWKISR